MTAAVRVICRLALVIGVVLLSGCGDSDGLRPAAADVVVPEGEVVAVRRDRSVVRVGLDGTAHRLAQLPAEVGEPDAVTVGPDGRRVLVSAVRWDDDEAAVCDAAVLEVAEDGTLREVADGASAALTADGRRLAYFRYATVAGYCRRTDLVVRDLASGDETTVLTLDAAPVGSTPPGWPVAWSPDGDQIAHVTDAGAVVTDVGSGGSRPAMAAARTLAPVWLRDGRLLVLDGCCIGPANLRAADTGEVAVTVDRPVRSLRAARTGEGLWLVLEDRGLVRWDGEAAAPIDVLPEVLVASG